MSEENQVSTDTAADDVLSVEAFIKDLKQFCPADVIRESVRITPEGLFVDNVGREKILLAYAEWLKKKTVGALGTNEKRNLKRLFGTEEPSQYYILEGKNSLCGYLAAGKVKAPQNYNMPFYLGSLLNATNYLHPRDAGLQELKNVQVVQTSAAAATFQLKVKGRTYNATQEFLTSFRVLIERSKKLSRRYQYSTLLDALKALGRILFSAHFQDDKQCLLMPFVAPRKRVVLKADELVFILDDASNLKFCYEAKGINLYNFIKDEIGAAIKKQIIHAGSITLSNKNRTSCGAVRIKGETYQLGFNALRDFVEYCNVSDVPYAEIKGGYTIMDCLRAFSVVLERSEKIERRFVSNHVSIFDSKLNNFRIYEKWILAVAEHNVIMHCVEKGANKQLHGVRDGGKKNSGKFRRPRA